MPNELDHEGEFPPEPIPPHGPADEYVSIRELHKTIRHCVKWGCIALSVIAPSVAFGVYAVHSGAASWPDVALAALTMLGAGGSCWGLYKWADGKIREFRRYIVEHQKRTIRIEQAADPNRSSSLLLEDGRNPGSED